jgi:hypothetical protein
MLESRPGNKGRRYRAGPGSMVVRRGKGGRLLGPLDSAFAQ